MCLKGLIAAAFDSSEPLLLLRLVGAIPTYRVYRLYDILHIAEKIDIPHKCFLFPFYSSWRELTSKKSMKVHYGAT